MEGSRVLKQLNRPDSCTERDVVKPKKGAKAGSRHPENSEPSEIPAGGGRDQAASGLPAGLAAKQQSLKQQQGQQQQGVPMNGQRTDGTAAAGSDPEQEAAAKRDAAPASSPSLLAAAAAKLAAGGAKRAQQSKPMQQQQQDDMHSSGSMEGDADSEDAADDIEDSDFEQPVKKQKAASGTAAARRPTRRAAQQQPSYVEAVDADSESGASADEISEDEDSLSEKQQPLQQQRSSRPQRQQKQQPKQQEQLATGRARRAAAVAAVDRMRGAEATVQQQEQAIRRSTRTRRAATESPDDSGDDVPVVRPRRAAAAAAKQATAAALAAEAAPMAWASQHGSDSSDLGTPDASDADVDDAAQGMSSDEGGIGGSESDGSGATDDDAMEGGSGSWGTGSKRQRSRAQPTRQQPKRGRGNRAVAVDDSDEPGSDAGDDEGSPEAADGSEEGGDLPLPLDAFRFNGKAPAAAAAAGGKCGAAKRRGSSGSGSGGSREGSEEPDAAAQVAALQEEEELSRDVLDASEFAPVEVDKLSRGDDLDKCLDVRYEEDDSITVLVKLVGKSYRHAVWVPAAAVEKKRPHLLRNFLSRQAGGDIDTDWAETNNINPAWYKIDRIISEYKHARKAAEYCVKWCGLEYSEATWEAEEEICRDGAGKVALARFKRWSTPAHLRATQSKRPRQELVEQKLLPDFKNGRKLRDYQEESLHWMINNYRGQIVSGKWKPRNCILGDEMGLGKTAQSIAVISWLKQYAGASAPVLVVAPLTTLGHWKREIETWTDLNVVLYAGSAQDRQLIREFEFYYPKHKTSGPRFNVLLSSYETVLKDKSELRKLHFEALIVDEAHRLKNQKSATRQALQDMSVRWLLMLSGTPVQNNMRELQGLMSLLDEELYGDTDKFLEKFGSDAPTLEQIRALQAALAPVLLRRMKEDVEDLPEKEEVVIWVELTPEQRRYYRALYSQQIGALLGGVSNKNLPGMRNLAMELRKLCCHPFLCDGLEDDMTLKWGQAAAEAKTQREREIENYTRASGKMLLLHKLLPKLRAEGRQVLIFSQFKMMLDVIEDYLTACDFPFERIDGDTKHSARQAAIDRFMAVKDRQRSKTPTSRAASPSPGAAAADGSSEQGGEGQAAVGAGGSSGQQAAGSSRGPSPSAMSGQEEADGPFVFLLSTRAGGQGITLTSADTVIIYDSDWNPQNDLQAMARCHRIGQEKEVTVYRLVSKNTYEQQLFETSSRKMGLDEAILGFAGSGENPENDAARIEQLLRLGAHAIMGGAEDKGDAAGEDKGFAAEDIEQILIGRSEKRQLGSRKGNTFSIAHFGDGGGELEPEQEEAQAAEVVAKSAKDFWTELLPEAAAEHAARANRKEPEVLGPRHRKQVDYREANMGARSASSSDFTGTEDGDEEEGEGASCGRGTKRAAEGDAQQGGKKAKKKADESSVLDPELGRVIDIWKASHVDVVRDALLRFGPDQMDRAVQQCVSNEYLKGRQPDEVEQMAKGLIVALGEMGRLAPALQQEEKAAKAAVVAAAAAGDLTAQTASKSHGNLSVQYISKMRDALIQGGVEAKLPPACAKALLSSNCVRTMGRAPATLIQQLDDHRKVHQAMKAAGLVKDSSKPAAAAAAGSSQQQQQDLSTPAISQPAAAAKGEAPKRIWVAPRVLLKGSKGVPLWWKRDHDDLLLQGCYAYGYSAGSRLNSIVEAILQDPVYGFTSRFGLDPEALVMEKAAREANTQPMVPVQVQVPGADGQPMTTTVMQRPKPVVNPVAAAAAKEKKQQLQQQHPGIELLGTVEMHRLVTALVQRLKRVRTALLDPNYVEPATPSKQLHMLNATAAAAGPAAPPAAAAAGTGQGVTGVQQRLQLAPNGDGSLTYKGRKVIGGGLPHAAAAVVAAAAAAGGGPARTPPGAVPPNISPEAARQIIINQQRVLAQQNATQIAQAARTAATLAINNAAMQAHLQVKKRQAEEQINSANKRPNSNSFSPVGPAQQQQQRPMLSPQQAAMVAATAAVAAEMHRRTQMQNQRDMLQRQQQAQQQRQQQQQQPEVVELLDDDSSDDEQPVQANRQQPPAATPAAGAAAPAVPVNPPSSGLEVRRVPAGADLSQEQSVDEPEGAAAAAAAAAGTASSSGKHMQQLLGERQPGTSPKKSAVSKAAAAEHPVYGTPAGGGGGAATAGTKRKQGKDDPSQRKIEAFFAASGPK